MLNEVIYKTNGTIREEMIEETVMTGDESPGRQLSFIKIISRMSPNNNGRVLKDESRDEKRQQEESYDLDWKMYFTQEEI